MKVALAGANGRMGGEIKTLIEAETDLVLYAEIDSGKKSFSSLKGADVLIDFTTADVFSQVCKQSAEAKVPLVSGTTGINDSDFEALKAAGASVPVLWSPNMSLGIAVFKRLISQLHPIKDSYDFQILESHHKHKIDSPSGTAIYLQNEVEEHLGGSVEPPLAIRGGGIFGEHELQCMATEEVLSIKHTALNRAVFARGALKAAKWIVGQSAGVYTMDDLLAGS